MFDPRLETLKPQISSYWAGRALYQIEYAHEVLKTASGQYAGPIEQAITSLLQANGQDGAITQAAARQVEALLAPLAPAAKQYNVICAAHAHIDMNWMWRWDETVAISLDTFRTMLDLMREYPDFKFSQSQASVYQIVEQYDPDMLDEIRLRVKEGRWEVTASTWVEADKNMPNGESHARHLLYTRRYLTRLFDLTPDQFQLDFEPDTFGHSATTPEILAGGGVKYYYHCRGDQSHHLYHWLAPSGRSILSSTVSRPGTWAPSNRRWRSMPRLSARSTEWIPSSRSTASAITAADPPGAMWSAFRIWRPGRFFPPSAWAPSLNISPGSPR
jgi:alpha-mannosidase